MCLIIIEIVDLLHTSICTTENSTLSRNYGANTEEEEMDTWCHMRNYVFCRFKCAIAIQYCIKTRRKELIFNYIVFVDIFYPIRSVYTSESSQHFSRRAAHCYVFEIQKHSLQNSKKISNICFNVTDSS